MDTTMHRAALPDADPGSLLDPATVAARIVRALTSDGIRPGARLEASSFEVAS
jgi:hypothetical protein